MLRLLRVLGYLHPAKVCENATVRRHPKKVGMLLHVIDIVHQRLEAATYVKCDKDSCLQPEFGTVSSQTRSRTLDLTLI